MDIGTVQRKPCESSNLASYGYDVDRQVLAFEFKSGDVLEYQGVPLTVFMLVDTATSKGQAYHRYIHGRFAAEKFELPNDGVCDACGDIGPIGKPCLDCGCARYIAQKPIAETLTDALQQRKDSAA